MGDGERGWATAGTLARVLRRAVSGAIYALSGAIGVMAFIYPLVAARDGAAQSLSAPLVTAGLVGLSVVALVVELQGEAVNAKMVALLGVLIAIASVLRFLEVAFPLPGGFSPIFAPIILAGYVFGARFGFLMGVFTLLTSSLITGAIGPWLPYQMYAAGWVGLTSAWLPRAPHRGRGRFRYDASARVALCAAGLFWGVLYGAILNVYFWPFASGAAETTWSQGIGLGETLRRYAAFYLATSLVWDLARGAGNVALILLIGGPMVMTLDRFRRRLSFEVRPDA